jgi:hypothetical protein
MEKSFMMSDFAGTSPLGVRRPVTVSGRDECPTEFLPGPQPDDQSRPPTGAPKRGIDTAATNRPPLGIPQQHRPPPKLKPGDPAQKYRAARQPTLVLNCNQNYFLNARM